MDATNPRRPRGEKYNSFGWFRDEEGNVEMIKIPPRPSVVLVAKLDCDLCQNPFVRQKFEAKLQLPDLIEGSEKGCQHCKVMTKAIFHFFGGQIANASKEFAIRITVNMGDTSWRWSNLEIYNYTKDLFVGTIQFYVTEEPGKFEYSILVIFGNNSF